MFIKFSIPCKFLLFHTYADHWIIYIRWGKKICPSGAHLVYSGIQWNRVKCMHLLFKYYTKKYKYYASELVLQFINGVCWFCRHYVSFPLKLKKVACLMEGIWYTILDIARYLISRTSFSWSHTFGMQDKT
jgi:hypothetical protein